MATGPSINRGGSDSTIATPWIFIQALEARFGPLAFDLAAEHHTAKAPRYFTKEDDSLKQDWHKIDGLQYLNPPYDNITPWARKCALESRLGAKILFLVPASVGSNWFADYVWPHSHVIGLNGRIMFVGQDHGYPKDLMLDVFGGITHTFSTWRWNPWSLI